MLEFIFVCLEASIHLFFYMRKLLLLLLVTLLWSCQKDIPGSEAYLHGQVDNPLVDYIVLSKNEKLIDTIRLDTNNSFSYTLKDMEEGLFSFDHSYETQTIYISPNDSVLFRLNTLAFDETIYYSGTAADKNNLLTELFLLNEKNNDFILSYYKIDPIEFAQITDSILQKRKQMFHQMELTHDFSKKFSALAHNAILYEFYDLRERYAFVVNKYSIPRAEIPAQYFDYRAQVNFNDPSLQSLYVYQRFLDNYLKNRSIENCGKRSENRDCYNLNDYQNLNRRILLTDSLFSLTVLKNRFYKLYGRKQIIFSKEESQIDQTLALLKKLGYTGEGYEELENIAEIQHTFFIGNNITQKELIDANLQTIKLEKILDKPTITFMWSMARPRMQAQKHEKIKSLRIKYPEINFIGINIDVGETEKWHETIQEFKYNLHLEFQIKDFANKKKVYKNYLNKTLFINQQGRVVFGRVPLNSSNLESYIVEFLNL